MKSLKLLSLWVLPAFLAWWGSIYNGHLATKTFACPDFACIDSVNVRLNNNCKITLQPQMVVASEIDPDCLADLQVEVFSPQGQSIGNTILSNYAGQFLTYKLTNTLTGNICWGHVRVEDKSAPNLVCPKDTEEGIFHTTGFVLKGELKAGDPNFDPSRQTCFLSTSVFGFPSLIPGNRNYDLNEFKVDKDGIYTFYFNGAFNGLAAMYAGAKATGADNAIVFNRYSPCEDIISLGDYRFIPNRFSGLGEFFNFLGNLNGWDINVFGNGLQPAIRIFLKANTTYTLLTSSKLPNETGKYAWVIFPTNDNESAKVTGIDILPLPPSFFISDLICTDKEFLILPAVKCYWTNSDGVVYTTGSKAMNAQLRAVLERTGFPHKGDLFNGKVTDNCNDIQICVGDRTQDYGDCRSWVVERTFSATDTKGNGVLCTQRITIRKPSIQDVILPHFTQYIECDEAFAVDSTGYPHPSVTGYPFVHTTFGIKDLSGEYCKLAATYTNKSRVALCDRAYTFLREWVIYDWCNPGSTLIYNQLIKVGDFTPPTVVCSTDEEDCPPVFSTGPFACTAVVTIPAPDTIYDNCSNWTVLVDVIVVNRTPIYDQEGEIEDYTYEEVVVATGKKPGDFVNNIPKGVHLFRYRVQDDCRNVRVQDCEFEVLDRSEPIAICKDFLNISIGGNSQVSKLYAADVDAGSFDNCSNIKIQVRRIVKEECIDEYEYIVSQVEVDTTDGGDGGNPIGEPPILGGGGGLVLGGDNPGPRPGGEDDPLAGDDDEEDDDIYRSEWADFVYLTCCDVGDTVRIELRVWDDADGNGIPGDSENVDYCGRLIEDNYNVCWLDVLLEDKSKPICKPPLDLTVSCTDPRIHYQPTFTCADSILLDTLFGAFIATDNCEANMICDAVIDARDNCGVGTITRIAYAEDAVGNRSAPCRQVITVTKANNYEIKFPADVSGECKLVRDTVIDVQNLACDLLAISVVDERFNTGADECFKIHRTFRVINWCEYDGISPPIIISRDEDCDGKPGDEAVYILRRPGAGNAMPAFIDRNGNETDQIPAAGTRGKTCDGNTNPKGYWRKSNSVGFWQYTQVLKVYDSEPPNIIISSSSVQCVNGDSCSADISIPFIAEDDCSYEEIRFEVVIDYYNDSVDLYTVLGPRIRGQYPKYRFEHNFPIGEHLIEIRIKDGCGNYNSVRVPVRVEDCKAPTPVCVNGVAAELMPVIPAQDVNGDGIADKGATVIWATDFIASPQNDCTGPVTYSISRVGEIANRNQKSLTLTCEDAGNTVPILIYSWDNANNPRSVQPDGTRGGANYAYCLTYLLVQDNMLNCENADSSRMTVTGRVATEYGMPLAGVPVIVENGLRLETQTNVQGMYAASANIINGNKLVNVTPDFDFNYQENISTFDIILITKHILGVQALNSPYKMIAADINNSQSITSLDVIQLRKLILGVETRFPKNKSWRFIDKNFVFPQPEHPWLTPFPETLRMNADTLRHKINADFVAVKIGDVSTNAGQNARNLANTVFKLETADQDLEPFKTYQIDFMADVAQTDGYQFTLQFDTKALDLTDVTYGLSTAENFGWRWLDQGQIVTSWNKSGQGQLSGSQKLFTLTFQSKKAGQLHDYLSIETRPTLAEAYSPQGEIKEVQISFQPLLTLRTPFTLYQNKPNPFSDETIIGFNMREAATARLQIYSADGRLITSSTASYNSGYQEIRVLHQDLRGPGVYYYILEINGWRETRKMLLD